MNIKIVVRRVIPFILLCNFNIFTACRQERQLRPDHARIAGGVEMRDVRFYSEALGRQMPYRVFLPTNLQPGEKLFTVYLLHGAYNDFRSWSNFSDVSQFARDGFLLVMPEGGASSYFMNAVEAPKDKFEDYVTRDLIADVEARFPVRRGRDSRAVIGISMGGLAAVDYALAHPDLFRFVGALSPSIDAPSRRFSWKRTGQWWRFRRVFGPVGSSERRARDPFVMIQSADPKTTPFIYLTAGRQEALMGPIRRFAASLKKRNFDYEFRVMQGGHDWNQWNAQIPGCFASLREHVVNKIR
ncbi:MAG TPA: alpha/beta hydrolase-fold protein [Terracidiphilus sp.]|nr:alpha/beta hydrolase-fold protein [Terracidiphilus sp.]